MRLRFSWLLLAVSAIGVGQAHDHPVPEKLGRVSFPTSCSPLVQADFNRAVALLHSFTYHAADQAFQRVAQQDPGCAIAHWGSAMTHYHQLWDLPPSPADREAAELELRQAERSPSASERERRYIRALRLVFADTSTIPYSTRALRYEAAMHQLATAYPGDTETQIFYALALISNASPTDREHQRQKQAADLLEPLFRSFGDHPGIPHYLIHAYDNQELASRGIAAARVYAGIAPSAPHALHMPSHIFTRLGLWDDSIASNLAARAAAHQQGDTGEEVHATDYLVYAYLQSGRDQEAARLVQQVNTMQNLSMRDFKIGYAATAIPIRYIVERGSWKEAERVANPSGAAPPHVVAIAAWARGLGLAKEGHPGEAQKEAEVLDALEKQLRTSGDAYWATQVDIMRREVKAWSAQAAGRTHEAAEILSNAAADEDALEKRPVTPGPILPAREQLGELFLQQGTPAAAADAFRLALTNYPGRRRALQGAAQAALSTLNSR